MNIVISLSKDWFFNQILACLWSFFEHISIYFDLFLYLCRQTTVIYHGKVKSYKSRSRRTRLKQ